MRAYMTEVMSFRRGTGSRCVSNATPEPPRPPSDRTTMQTLTEIKELLASRGLSPRHRLGQNFLHDHNQLRKIVEAGEVSAGDLVLEVGPGTGTLTEALVEAGAEVIASEIDEEMASIVESRLGDRVRLVLGDCLIGSVIFRRRFSRRWRIRPFRLVANLPYQAATPLLMDLLIRRSNCLGQVALIQKEVADRLAAGSGGREYGPISVITAVLGSIRRVTVVPPGCFWPQPKVTSAVVSIVPDTGHAVENPEAFADFVGNLFRTRRKQIGTILGRDRVPEGFDPRKRPEEFPPEALLAMFQAMDSA